MHTLRRMTNHKQRSSHGKSGLCLQTGLFYRDVHQINQTTLHPAPRGYDQIPMLLCLVLRELLWRTKKALVIEKRHHHKA